MSDALLEEGFLVPCCTYELAYMGSIPKPSLRVVVRSGHSEDDCDDLAAALASIMAATYEIEEGDEDEDEEEEEDDDEEEEEEEEDEEEEEETRKKRSKRSRSRGRGRKSRR